MTILPLNIYYQSGFLSACGLCFMLMSALGRAIQLTRPLIRARRAVLGPKRPSWNLELETVAEVMRLSTNASTLLPITVQRRLVDTPRAETDAVRQTKVEQVIAGGVPAEWYFREDTPEDRVVIYLHGGGYSTGSLRSHRDLFCRLCKDANARVLALDYRLAPEHAFPAPVYDVVAAYRWLLTQGVAPQRIGLAGDSAGGGLSVAALLMLRNEDLKLPKAAATLSAWLDLGSGGTSMKANQRYDYVTDFSIRRYADRYVNKRDRMHPLASPLYADLKGLPPLFVQVGAAETLLDHNLRFADRARDLGVPVELDVWPDMIHGWHLFAPFLEQGRRAIGRVGAFFCQQFDER